jgi:hypothetical protein
MLLTSPEGERYLDGIRQAVRAVIEYGSPEAAAVALGVTVEEVEERRSSVYGCAFIEFVYGPCRDNRRKGFALALFREGMSVPAIARTLGMDDGFMVRVWLGFDAPPAKGGDASRVEGLPCRNCQSTERYKASRRCVACAMATMKRMRAGQTRGYTRKRA